MNDLVGALDYVKSGATVNPAGAAQTYSKILRDAYMAIKGMGYQHVDVIDTQAAVFRWT